MLMQLRVTLKPGMRRYVERVQRFMLDTGLAQNVEFPEPFALSPQLELIGDYTEYFVPELEQAHALAALRNMMEVAGFDLRCWK